MDVSVLLLQGGMFITQSLAGNNRLGGQDFNDLTLKFLQKV
jgi:stress 70 chaperone-associated protein